MLLHLKIAALLLILFIGVANAQTINTVAGTGTFGNTPDSVQATTTELWQPNGVTTDHLGNYYIASRNFIRKVDLTGLIKNYAGGGTGLGNGVPAITTAIGYATSIITDCHGNLYFTDKTNKVVRKIDTLGIITTVAGGGTNTGTGIPADSALLGSPYGVAVDCNGNIFFTDITNYNILKVDATSGMLTIFAGYGIPGWTGDGVQATNSALNEPRGIGTDVDGNVYFADQLNHRIRKINTSGIITTVAGSGFIGFAGDGGNATDASLNTPTGVMVDALGNVYFADMNGNRVRYVNTSGIINSITGTGIGGFSGDGLSASLAQVNKVLGLAIKPSGELLIADTYNNRIRKITDPLKINSLLTTEPEISVYPNPAKNELSINASGFDNKETNIKIYNPLGQVVFTVLHIATTTTSININGLAKGIYFLEVSDFTVNKKIKIMID